MDANAAPKAAGPAANAAERRRFPRLKVMSRLRGYWVDLDLPVTVREASLGGFSVVSATPFPIGQQQSVLLSTFDGRETLAQVVCRHCTRVDGMTPAVYIAGFEFPPQQADNLDLIVETLQAIASRDGGRGHSAARL